MVGAGAAVRWPRLRAEADALALLAIAFNAFFLRGVQQFALLLLPFALGLVRYALNTGRFRFMAGAAIAAPSFFVGPGRPKGRSRRCPP